MKFAFFLSASFLFLGILHAKDDVTFRAQVDRTTLTMNESLTLQLTISGSQIRLNKPSIPKISGFRVYSSGQSQNFNFINGQASSQIVYSYSLAPEAPGEYVIPSFGLQVGGQNLRTDPIKIKVLSGSTGSPSQPKQPGQPASSKKETSPGTSRPREALFITTSLDKKTAYVGEQISLSFRFYNRVRLAGQPAYQPPDTTGFITEDLPPQSQFVENVNGQQYSVIELITALFPTSAGNFTIGPAQLRCQVRQTSRDPFSSLMDDFFSRGRAVNLQSDPIKIKILPLPEKNKPSSFKGEVGRYQISAKLDKKKIMVYEPVTLTVEISGEGNVKSISTPGLPKLEGIKVYETISSLNVSKDGGRVTGSKVFKTIIKPEVSGKISIPSISMTFFDPKEKRYRTTRTKNLTIFAQPSQDAKEEFEMGLIPIQEGIRIIGTDIRYIRTQSEMVRWRPPVTETKVFLMFNFLPGFLFLGAWGIKAYRLGRLSDPRGMAFRSAYKSSQKILRQAQKLLKKEKYSEFYELLHKSFMDYLGKKMGVSSQGLLWIQVEEALKHRSIEEEEINSVRLLWEELDLVRYAPSKHDHQESAEQNLDKLTEILKKVEKKWKK